MGLVALREAEARFAEGPGGPGAALRTVLAMLYSLGDGEMAPFQEFWTACRHTRRFGDNDHLNELCRRTAMSVAANGIKRELAAPFPAQLMTVG